jgi:hypothetical protein
MLYVDFVVCQFSLKHPRGTNKNGYATTWEKSSILKIVINNVLIGDLIQISLYELEWTFRTGINDSGLSRVLEGRIMKD